MARLRGRRERGGEQAGEKDEASGAGEHLERLQVRWCGSVQIASPKARATLLRIV
jgi:hypothetical protein